MANLLNDSIRGQVREVFEKQVQQPVGILFFEKKEDCDYCADTRQLLEEVTSLSEKLSLETYDLEEHTSVAEKYHVDKAPGIVFVAKDGNQVIDYGIRMAGIPSGHEFGSLIQDIILVAGRDSGLDPKTREELKALTKPVHLQVFVTPT